MMIPQVIATTKWMMKMKTTQTINKSNSYRSNHQSSNRELILKIMPITNRWRNRSPLSQALLLERGKWLRCCIKRLVKGRLEIRMALWGTGQPLKEHHQDKMWPDMAAGYPIKDSIKSQNLKTPKEVLSGWIIFLQWLSLLNMTKTWDKQINLHPSKNTWEML
jgi:hypothetical protein